MKKILFVVDAQNDFMPGGSLAVPEGDKIIPRINELLADPEFEAIWFSRDFHPENHTSFAKNHNVEPFTEVDGETKWPVHCVVGSHGAEINKDILIALEYTGRLWGKVFDIPKGMDPAKEEYSALQQPDVNDFFINSTKDIWTFNGNQVEIVFSGLAFEVCLLSTVEDAIKLLSDIENVKISVDMLATKWLTEEGKLSTVEKLKKMGVNLVNL